jgi:prepilin-type processing-associated H-X9-DG protein
MKRKVIVTVALLHALTWAGGCLTHSRELDSRARRIYAAAPKGYRSESGPATGITWCIPLLPGVLLANSWYVVGPSWGEGGVKIVLYYGFGAKELDRPAPRLAPSRTVDASKLKQIGLACLIYAGDYSGEYPADLAQLREYFGGGWNPDVFLADQSRTLPGPMDEVMRWTDFVYVGGATSSAPADRILAFQPPGQHPHDAGANVLFVDGRVQWFDLRGFIMAMNATRNSRAR